MTYAFTYMRYFLLLTIEIWAVGLDLGLFCFVVMLVFFILDQEAI